MDAQKAYADFLKTYKPKSVKKTAGELLEAVHSHAVQNYTVEGWDYWVEAYDDSDRLEVIKGAKTIKGAIKKARADCKIIHDHENEVRSTEW